MISASSLLYSALYLLPAAIISGFHIALQALGSIEGKEELKDATRFPLVRLFSWGKQQGVWLSILFTLSLSKFIYYLIFGFVSFYFLFWSEPTSHLSHFSFYDSSAIEICIIVGIFLCLELSFSLIIEGCPRAAARFLSLPASLLMLPFLPLTLLYFLGKKLSQQIHTQPRAKLPFKLQDKIVEHLSETELGSYLDEKEKKLIHTAVSFKERIVREVMVPRIDIVSLASDTPLSEAIKLFDSEGYSRIPVYRENIDKVLGVLLYKDVLSIYCSVYEKKSSVKELEKPIEAFVKPVLYTPETKKIAELLQEFKSKHIHLAIVVDEYGGTEGIVTIEDVLEELVGEIEDEYDFDEEKLFAPLQSGGWIVDAKMSILDAEENLGIQIPNSVEYDTIGGYIFHRAGSIPSKGWKAHLDEIDLEVLKSDDRSIHKIKITEKKNPKAKS